MPLRLASCKTGPSVSVSLSKCTARPARHNWPRWLSYVSGAADLALNASQQQLSVSTRLVKRRASPFSTQPHLFNVPRFSFNCSNDSSKFTAISSKWRTRKRERKRVSSTRGSEYQPRNESHPVRIWMTSVRPKRCNTKKKRKTTTNYTCPGAHIKAHRENTRCTSRVTLAPWLPFVMLTRKHWQMPLQCRVKKRIKQYFLIFFLIFFSFFYDFFILECAPLARATFLFLSKKKINK